MNAVMRKREMAEGTDMPANENDSLGTQVAELRANVGHIQSDVTDIKTDLRTLRKETGDRFEKVEQKLETFRKETGDRFDTWRKETGDRFDTSRKETGDRFDTSRKETGDRFDKVEDRFEKVMQIINELRDSLASAKIWALWLYVGLAGSLFYVLARGFKWL
jgi:DNA anti-recombination protein RmuC